MPKPRNKKMPRVEKDFEEVVVQINRVMRVMEGGRRLRFRAIVAIGDKKGQIGLGVGKSKEVQGAVQKAVSKAKKQIVRVPIVNGTIPHPVKTKFKAARVLLLPAKPGTGIIAGSAVRMVLDNSGLRDIVGKSLGSSNRLNIAKATIKAVKMLGLISGQKLDDLKVQKERKEEKKGAKPLARFSKEVVKEAETKSKDKKDVKDSEDIKDTNDMVESTEEVENVNDTNDAKDTEEVINTEENKEEKLVEKQEDVKDTEDLSDVEDKKVEPAETEEKAPDEETVKEEPDNQ